MNTSLFELFKIGIGPSSSHTVGPMRAALRFVSELPDRTLVQRIEVELYGSLAHTGHGHGTDRAILLGLSGEQPDTVDPAAIDTIVAHVRSSCSLKLGGSHLLPFNEPEDLVFRRDLMLPPGSETHASHPNGMRLTALNAAGAIISRKVFYSVGGGFILSAAELAPDPVEKAIPAPLCPLPFLECCDSPRAGRRQLSVHRQPHPCQRVRAPRSRPTPARAIDQAASARGPFTNSLRRTA